MNKLYAVLGPSGSGKSSLVEYAKKKTDIEEITSHTTRDMREGETEGNPYYFITEEEFNDIDFIEEVEYANNKYGISHKEVNDKLSNDKNLLVIVDIEGVNQLKYIYGDIVEIIYVYATPYECRERLEKSRGIDEASFRLSNALLNDEFNNHNIADYIIRNKDFDKAKRQFVNILKDTTTFNYELLSQGVNKNNDVYMESELYPDPIIAIDFDNTIAETDFPEIKCLKEGAKEAINSLKNLGCKIAIWTCRTGAPAEQAKQFLIDEGIKFDAFNTNDALPEGFLNDTDFSDSRKIGADLYVDDKSIEFKDNWDSVLGKIIEKMAVYLL